MGLLASYYMHKIRHDDNILHYRRSPTWRSWVLFAVFLLLNHFVSLQSPYVYLRYLCYTLGLYFSYLSTEKYEEVIFDRQKGSIRMMNARVLQKWTIGYTRQIVSELGEVLGVAVESVRPTMFGEAHQVVLVYLSGLTLSLTSGATYGNKKHHETVAQEVKKFLRLLSSSAGVNSQDSDKDEEEADTPPLGTTDTTQDKKND